MDRNEGRLCVVTGAAKGIGEAIVRRLVEERARVIISDVDEEGETLAALLRKSGGDVHFRPLNVADAAQVSQFAKNIVEEFGPVFGLVNNAGIVIPHEALTCSDDVWRKTLDVNLDGSFYCSREFGKQMALSGGGAIVNLSSIAGMKVVRPETHVAYGVSKAAIAHMTALLAVEWARHNIRVNAVAPGYTSTTILSGMRQTDPGIVAAWMNDIPMERFIEPSEIAGVVSFLLSKDANCVTGQTLAADCGYSKW
jgi:NAD(P)-dependent dehydrogenase (short-subunit alcohol dehydrogenase family)